MKKLLFLLTISVSSLYCMEEKTGAEKLESTATHGNQTRLWHLLGNTGAPELKFIAALDLIKQNETEITSAHIPEELKEYIFTLKKALGTKILELMRRTVLLDSDRENIELLINAGADLDVQDKKGYTALINAANYSNEEGVKLLISAGANLDIPTVTTGSTALMAAAFKGSIPIVKHLINAGANINRHNVIHGNTALMLAVEERHADLAKLLIDSGANLNVQNNDGYTPLIWAVQANFKDLIELLVQEGADVTLKDGIGMTAIDHAFYPETKKLLKERLPSSS